MNKLTRCYIYPGSEQEASLPSGACPQSGLGARDTPTHLRRRSLAFKRVVTAHFPRHTSCFLNPNHQVSVTKPDLPAPARDTIPSAPPLLCHFCPEAHQTGRWVTAPLGQKREEIPAPRSCGLWLQDLGKPRLKRNTLSGSKL